VREVLKEAEAIGNFLEGTFTKMINKLDKVGCTNNVTVGSIVGEAININALSAATGIFGKEIAELVDDVIVKGTCINITRVALTGIENVKISPECIPAKERVSVYRDRPEGNCSDAGYEKNLARLEQQISRIGLQQDNAESQWVRWLITSLSTAYFFLLAGIVYEA